MTKPRSNLHMVFLPLLALLGTGFCFWYVFAASRDVVYSDYIRIINEYLPDVEDLSVMLTPDILTRTPIYFLQRIINVRYFGYSVMFDRICTLFGIALIAFSLTWFMIRERISALKSIAVFVVVFSLSKWEVFMNGTCWTHVVSIGLFLWNYLLFDRVWKGESDVPEELLLYFMPFLWLLLAGEYIASYAASMCLIAAAGALTGGAAGHGQKRVRKVCLRILLCTLFAGALYVFSRSFAVWEHAGSTDMTILELIRFAPTFLPKLFLKSLAGTVFGAETITSFYKGEALSDIFVLLTGLMVLLAYFFAALVYFDSRMQERTVFPILLLVSGFLNHGLVTYARWIFLNENYGLSSRYAVQFMVGILGILLIFALFKTPPGRYRERARDARRRKIRAFMVFFAALSCAGNLYTSYQEVKKAPYRKANYETMQEMILGRDEIPVEELCRALEWHKDPADLTKALDILEASGLNVYRTGNAVPEKGR